MSVLAYLCSFSNSCLSFLWHCKFDSTYFSQILKILSEIDMLISLSALCTFLPGSPGGKYILSDLFSFASLAYNLLINFTFSSGVRSLISLESLLSSISIRPSSPLLSISFLSFSSSSYSIFSFLIWSSVKS